MMLNPPPPHPPCPVAACSAREQAAFAVRGIPLDPNTGQPLPRGPTIPQPFRLATDALHTQRAV